MSAHELDNKYRYSWYPKITMFQQQVVNINICDTICGYSYFYIHDLW